MAKLVTAREAVNHIPSNATLFINSFGGFCYPEVLAQALGERFDETFTPTGIDFWASVTGSRGLGKHSERFVREGMFRRAVLSHWLTIPPLMKQAQEEKIQAYNIPMGTYANLIRAAAGRKPAIITETGIGTEIDPRLGGGKFNKSAKEDLCEVVQIDGNDYLMYKVPKIDVCLMRGTTADPEFNVTMEKEPGSVDMLALAQACKANGGLVICQVERLSNRKAYPKQVKLPGFLIDYLVLAPDQMINRAEIYNPCYVGELDMPASQIDAHLARLKEMTRNLGKTPKRDIEDYIIARRATDELCAGALVNLGYGIPDMVGGFAYENGITNDIMLTVESGVLGGVPGPGVAFGTAINPKIIYEQSSQFDLYNGRGLDLSFVGAAEVDEDGNVNVSRIGGMLIGVGGFIDITQRSKKNVFVTTFMGGRMKAEYKNGKLNILEEGKIVKFKKKVRAISFSGNFAKQINQQVIYVTERCVFELTGQGLKLVEIAPGINLKKDILEKMEFMPIISDNLPLMKSKYFESALLDLQKATQV